ncbi:hypothetical protein GCM10023147_30470 [Tsukamurella soli]|uniref:Uncharacterized protein n=2 Tax=Tsukamurella soli TaxID=644556 RepID=A0ABP8JUM0_9ACTN
MRVAWRAFLEFRRTQIELSERRLILLEPWTHDLLHWGADGTLHGTVVTGPRMPVPVTRDGWCPCRPLDAPLRRAADRRCGTA